MNKTPAGSAQQATRNEDLYARERLNNRMAQPQGGKKQSHEIGYHICRTTVTKIEP